MLQGLYAAAAGMEAQQTQLDAISNDIANSDTPGYQGQEVGFRDLLYSTGGYGAEDATPVGSGAAASVIGYSQAQGGTDQTGNPLDVAINGDGYLEAKQGDGTIGLTRNGTLQVSGSGQLTTNLGMPLEPPVTLPAGTDPKDIRIATDGTVSVGATTVGKITLVTVPAPDQMIASGSGMFTPTTGSGGVRAASGATLQQGALEQSNVDLNDAMTEMIQTEQSYDLASKAISFETQFAQIADQVKQ
jgi:flagellar basal-body rod protein FlgG